MKPSKLVLASLALLLCIILQTSLANSTKSTTTTATTLPPFPQSVIKEMATRQMRYHHYLWHQLRDNWNRLPKATQDEFTKIGWVPPNPTRDSNGNLIKNNLCGEEFLYMHRDMIATANQIIAQNKDPYGSIKGWKTIPAPGDALFPVPPPYPKGNDLLTLASYKSDDYYYRRIKTTEQDLKDPAKLRKMSLNDLGVKIESGIHNDMHNRWSGPSPLGFRGGGNIGATTPNINKKWDNITYNWLVDTYSSQVNPVFWSIHGWIDDRIEDWRKAHGLRAITWKGTWTGGPMSSLANVMKKQMGHMHSGGRDPEAVGDVLQKGLQIFLKSGIPETSPMDVFPAVPGTKKQQKRKIRTCGRRRV